MCASAFMLTYVPFASESEPAAAIPCVECVEIRPSDDQLFKSPGALKHGLILFAGGQEVMHLKSDVLIEDLIEDQIQQRLHEERAERERKAAEAAAPNDTADQHATDLIPGVYEGNHPTQRSRYRAAESRSPPKAARPLYEFRSQNNYRHHASTTYDHRHDRHRDKRVCADDNNDDAAASSKRSNDRRGDHRRSHGTASSNHSPAQRIATNRRQCDDHRTILHHRRHSNHIHQLPPDRRTAGSSSKTLPPAISPPAAAKKPRGGRNEMRHPWFTDELAALIAMRERAHRKWLANKRRSKGDANWEAFRHCRSAASAVRRTVRDDYLAAALHVDRHAPRPWQTKGILNNNNNKRHTWRTRTTVLFSVNIKHTHMNTACTDRPILVVFYLAHLLHILYFLSICLSLFGIRTHTPNNTHTGSA